MHIKFDRARCHPCSTNDRSPRFEVKHRWLSAQLPIASVRAVSD